MRKRRSKRRGSVTPRQQVLTARRGRSVPGISIYLTCGIVRFSILSQSRHLPHTWSANRRPLNCLNLPKQRNNLSQRSPNLNIVSKAEFPTAASPSTKAPPRKSVSRRWKRASPRTRCSATRLTFTTLVAARAARARTRRRITKTSRAASIGRQRLVDRRLIISPRRATGQVKSRDRKRWSR